MKTINRDKIQRMIGNVGGNGGNGSSSADLAGYATQMWVEQNYISKTFFNTLFTIHGHDADDTAVPPTDVIIEPNDTETVLDSIEAMVGLWTEKYLSALGLSSGGGGGGDVLAEPLVSINGIGSPAADNQTLVWDGTRWTFKPYGQGGGSVTSIRITVPTGFNVTPSTITTAGTFAITFASGYSLPTTAKQTNWDSAYTWVNTNGATVLSNNHTHSNKTVLDGISSTKVSNWDTAYSKATTLEGYFDNSGNAKSALKLTTVSKKAWGQTYWTSGGVPTDIDGDMTSVGNISFSASGKNIGGVAYFDTTNSRLGIGTTSPSTSLHVVGRVTCEYDSTKKGSFSNVRGEYLTNYGINSSGFTIITTGQSSSSSSTVRISMTPYNAPEQYILFGASSSIKMGTTISNNTETYRDGTYIQIGGARIVWDSTNNALKVIKSDGTSAANFYATGAVSALGAGSGGGSGSGITMSDVWQAMAYTAPNTGSQQIHVSHLAQALSGYVTTGTLSNYVTLAGNQTITGGKTFAGNITLSSGMFKASVGGKFQTICIECNNDGSPNNRTGEINRYGSNTLHLQYDSGTGDVTMCRQKFQFSENQGISTLALGGNMLYLNAGSLAPITSIAWTTSSDIRLKTKVKDVSATVEQIANVRIFDFRWKKDGENGNIHFGSAAQDWQKIFPHAVVADNEGFLSMDYAGIAVGAVKTVAQEVVLLKKRVAELEKQLKAA